MTFFHLENLRFFRVRRTPDRLVRSGRNTIQSLLGDFWKAQGHTEADVVGASLRRKMKSPVP